MRLIDADLLAEEIESFRCTLTGLRNGKGLLSSAADEYRKSILQIIEDQPTAFDKEKAKEEMHDAADLSVEDGLWHVPLEEALDIVEKGGIK